MTFHPTTVRGGSRHRGLALGVGAPALAATGLTATLASPPQTEAPIPIGLYVDASAVAEQDVHAQLEQIVMQRLTAALEQAGYEVSDGKVATVLRVRFASTEANRFRDHGIYFEFVQGERVKPAIEDKLTAATPRLLESVGHEVEARAAGGADQLGDGDGRTTTRAFDNDEFAWPGASVTNSALGMGNFARSGGPPAGRHAASDCRRP